MNKDTIDINSIIYSLHPRHKSGDCGRVLSAKAQLEALINKKVKEARIDELMHISTDTNDEPCLCYFDEDGDCERDTTIEQRISDLKSNKE